MDLKIKDVAELLNVSETTIRRWLADGKIPAYRLNHQFRFSRIEIENWVMSCKMGKRKEGFALNKSEVASPGTQQFSLYRALHKGAVINNIQAKEKDELIRKAMNSIAIERNLDADVLTDLLLDRERLAPTALNHGVAVPHTRDFLLQEPFDVVALVFPEEPIEYGALDGQPVHSLFFLFACEDKRHLHLLAKIAHFVSDEQALAFLKTKPEKQEALEFIKNWEASVPKMHSYA